MEEKQEERQVETRVNEATGKTEERHVGEAWWRVVDEKETE